MNRPNQIRLLYTELKQLLDPSYSDRDILKLAHSIVLAHTAAGRVEDDNLVPLEGSRSFFSLPLDEAMQDGGWNILEFENRRGTALEDGVRTEFEDGLVPEILALVSRLKQIRRLT